MFVSIWNAQLSESEIKYYISTIYLSIYLSIYQINRVDKLTDDNWSYWSKVMYAILKKAKVWYIVIGTQRAPTGVDATDAGIDEFVNKQEKACGWLGFGNALSCTSN